MDRSCMFSPQRKRFYFLPMIYFHFFTLRHHTQFVSRYRYPCLRRICLLICLACMFAEASPARQMFWRASTHSHTPKSLSVAACKHTAEVFSTLANHLMKCRGGQKWCHFSRRSVRQKCRLLHELTLCACVCGFHKDTIQTGRRARSHFDKGKHPVLLAPRQQPHRRRIVRSTQRFYCGEECLNSHTTRQRAAEDTNDCVKAATLTHNRTHTHTRLQTGCTGPMMSYKMKFQITSCHQFSC